MGNLALGSLQLSFSCPQYWLRPFCFLLVDEGRVCSSSSILKALSDWMGLGFVLTPEQVPGQGLCGLMKQPSIRPPHLWISGSAHPDHLDWQWGRWGVFPEETSHTVTKRITNGCWLSKNNICLILKILLVEIYTKPMFLSSRKLFFSWEEIATCKTNKKPNWLREIT